MDIRELKEVYRIPAVWRDLGLPGEPGKICRSPFPGEHKHGDVNPSFSVFDEGRRWRDFATGESGTVIDLLVKARGCDVAEAIRFIEERLGIPRPEYKPNTTKKISAKIPPLREGTADELRELSERRGFAVEALKLAQQRGFLWFATLWGNPAWCVTDARREQFEFRRLDGQNWPACGRLTERKSHAYGSKRWPLGVLESKPFPKVALLEGAPDLLAAFHFMLVERKEQLVAPVAILGATNHHPAVEALAHFAGKHVCIFPHLDDSGRTAARAWALALREAGAARITGFDLSGIVTLTGEPGKDLADAVRLSADAFENDPKWSEVLP